MSDSDKRGVAHLHPRLMPKRWYSAALPFVAILSPSYFGDYGDYAWFVLPDHNSFGRLDLRDLVDSLDNEGEE